MIYKDEAYKIIGAAMAVHADLGPGFLETVYQEALAIEFELRKIPFRQEVLLPVTYKGYPLGNKYKADFICFDGIVVETKAINQLIGLNEAQVINYLKATGYILGLLINFGEESLKYKRIVKKR
jgi:GxxExxY protein